MNIYKPRGRRNNAPNAVLPTALPDWVPSEYEYINNAKQIILRINFHIVY